MDAKTPEQRAAGRYPYAPSLRDCYADCIREQVEPLEAENAVLRQWKEQSIKELNRWYKVFEALGRPGRLGEYMSEASLVEIQRLQASKVYDDDDLIRELYTNLRGAMAWVSGGHLPEAYAAMDKAWKRMMPPEPTNQTNEK